MNNIRRKELAAIVDLANKLSTLLDEIRNDLENIRDEEQDAYDNMPEGLQASERGENSEAAISQMEDALSMLTDLDPETLIGYLEEAAN